MLSRLLKAFTAVVMSMGLTMCHPVAAETKPQVVGEIAMADCLVADHYISTIYKMAKQGRGNYDIMVYLDQITDVDDREYIGILMAKLNVASVQTSVLRAYSEKVVVSRHKEICIKQIGNSVTRY